MKFIKKKYFFIFVGIFLFGFLVGYVTRTWDDYNSAWHGLYERNFWKTLSPF